MNIGERQEPRIGSGALEEDQQVVDDGGQLVEVCLGVEVREEVVELDQGAAARKELLEDFPEALGGLEYHVRLYAHEDLQLQLFLVQLGAAPEHLVQIYQGLPDYAFDLLPGLGSG